MNTVTVTDSKKTFTFDVYAASEIPASFKESTRFYTDLCNAHGAENVTWFSDEEIEDEDSARIEKLAIAAAGVEPEANVITVWKH